MINLGDGEAKITWIYSHEKQINLFKKDFPKIEEYLGLLSPVGWSDSKNSGAFAFSGFNLSPLDENVVFKHYVTVFTLENNELKFNIKPFDFSKYWGKNGLDIKKVSYSDGKVTFSIKMSSGNVSDIEVPVSR